MQIEYHVYIRPLLNAFPNMVNQGVQIFIGVLPSPIRIIAHDLAPGIAVDDPIGVDHGHHLDDHIASQILGEPAFASHKRQHALDHIAGGNLPGMLPRQHPNDLLGFIPVSPYDDFVHFVLPDTSAEVL